MSRKLTTFVVGVAGLFMFAVSSMQGCGGSSGGGDFKSLCMQGCDKAVSCAGDADATTISQIRMYCEAACNAEPTNCSNNSARISAAKACLAMSDCTGFQSCAGTIPPCQSSTGTGGTTGGAGTSGGGGAGGGSGAWTCQDDSANMACACARSPGGPLTACPTSYNCCFTIASGGSQGCLCSTANTAAECTQAAGILGGTVVTRCPP